MFEFLRGWMTGPLAGKTMLILRATFFGSMILSALLLLLPGRDTLRRGAKGRGQWLLALLTLAAFVAIAGFQARWQLLGATNPNFMRFVRRHNVRMGVDVRRGSILDRNGSLLAIDGEGGVRRQPLGAAAAHVVGYADPVCGLAGLEKAADDTLSGTGATPIEELQRLGRGILSSPPVEGADIRTTLDARLQRFAYNALSGRRGAIVVLDPSTGGILALVSAPSFDPIRPREAIQSQDAGAPLLNRATQGRYPPGSTFKVAMALMAADMGIAPILDCPAGGYRAEGESRPIRDSEYYIYKREGRVWRGFGKIGLREALVHSSNVYFAQLSRRIPGEAFNSYIERMGLNHRRVLYGDGKSALTATAGSVPVLDASNAKSIVQLSIGQGKMMVTPLDVAVWTAVAAASGELAEPTLDPAANASKRRIVSLQAAENVADMMRAAVKSGTGRGADIPGLGVCGKTGTAQNPGGEDHSWFTSFTTAPGRRIVVTVLVENGGFGSKGAVPIARTILEEAQRLGIVGRTEAGAQ